MGDATAEFFMSSVAAGTSRCWTQARCASTSTTIRRPTTGSSR
jgi:hypothetical protein